MNLATYSKIVKSKDFNDDSMSLGFRRFFCLPNKIKREIQIAAMIATNDTGVHNYIVSYFAAMSQDDYKTYVITH